MNYEPRQRIHPLALIGIAGAVLLLSAATAGFAQEKPAVKEFFGRDGIKWESPTSYQSADLVVTGPSGFLWRQTFAPGDALFLDFESLTGAYSPSGQYKYELVLTPAVSAADRALAQQARELGEEVDFLAHKAIPAVSGGFRIDEGAVVDRGLAESDALKLVHLDDVSIIGSLCVGFDCPNNPSFGFDTVRLQENNLRVHFNDTSSTASFPDNDWRITINDSSNGGAEYFSIDDASAGRQVFKIEAGAPSNSLYVDDGGRLGLGTNQPVVDLQVVSGNTPTLRLEQNGSSGFTPQTWDVAGNEANFFIRDATGGSTLPFRIQPGTGSNTLYLANDEQVGLGTTSPDQELDIEAATPAIRLTGLGTTLATTWDMNVNNSGRFNWNQGGDTKMRIDANADSNLLNIGLNSGGTADSDNVHVNGDITATGSITPDYVFDSDYALESIEEHAVFMWTNKHLPAVAPAKVNAEGKGIINLSARAQGTLKELEKAHIYIEQLDHRIDSLTSENVALKEQLARAREDLEMRITKLESR